MEGQEGEMGVTGREWAWYQYSTRVIRQESSSVGVAQKNLPL